MLERVSCVLPGWCLDSAVLPGRCLDSGVLPGRCLDSDGVGSDELAPHGDGPEDDLQAVKEILSDDDDSLTAGCPALARRHSLDLRHQGVRVQPCTTDSCCYQGGGSRSDRENVIKRKINLIN